ncbi:MAG: sigma-70 family RNA polymerase sigma factor [Acidobacteriaceae bacterium]|nr:sigma-70 family RNA polymerase sigma factor [Acidobacteriaceae bacterium]
MHDWIYAYVSRNLHETVPVDEFSNKLRGRLAALEHSRTSCVGGAIGKAVSDLVHDLNRTAIRRQARFVPRPEFDEVIDERPNIEDLLIERERQKKALMALSSLKERDRELVEQVCGIYTDRLTRKQIANKLGLERNSIDQRFKRIMDFIRNALGT